MAPLLAELLAGRPLRLAEQAIDVVRLDHAMNTAKDDVHEAIRLEIRRAVRRSLLTGARFRLDVTRGMLRPLERLHRLGRDEAAAELTRAGYEPARPPSGRKFEDAPVHYHRLDPLRRRLRDGLDVVEGRVSRDSVTLDLGDASATAVARALMNTPGARDLASRVVSTALYSGMGLSFETSSDLVGGWAYTAILDQGTCEICEGLDGSEYPSWDAIQEVLPDGGPNPACFGDGRCRCRAVPLPA